MSTETRADLSLYGLREHFEDQVENKVDKEIASDGESYRVLSDKNFSDDYEYKLITLHNEYVTRPLIPVPDKTGLLLTSVKDGRECAWSDVRAEFDSKIQEAHKSLNEELEMLKSTDEELRYDVYNRCTIEETKILIKNEVGQYLGNPELVETLKKLNIALKEQHNSETVGEYLLSEFENKYDKSSGEYLEKCIEDIDTRLRAIKPYKLPVATTEVLGGVKAGYGLTVQGDGLLSLNPESIVTREEMDNKLNKLEFEVPAASTEVLGGVKVSPTGGLIIDEEGYLKIDNLETKAPEEWDTKLKNKISYSCIMVGKAEFSDKTVATEIETDGREVRHVSITPMSLYYNREGEILPLSFYYKVEEGKVLVYSNIDYNVKDDAPVLFSYMVLLKDQEQ